VAVAKSQKAAYLKISRSLALAISMWRGISSRSALYEETKCGSLKISSWPAINGGNQKNSWRKYGYESSAKMAALCADGSYQRSRHRGVCR
jgi:hypothetical protein